MKDLLGKQIDKFYRELDSIDKARAKLNALEAKHKAFEDRLIVELQNAKLHSAAGSQARVTIVHKDHPRIADMQKFWEYAKKHNAFDLFQRRVNTLAWEERSKADGARIPGTEAFITTRLMLTKATKK